MTTRKPTPIAVGMRVQDRDPRCDHRRGVVTRITSTRAWVLWNTNRETTFAIETFWRRVRLEEGS